MGIAVPDVEGLLDLQQREQRLLAGLSLSSVKSSGAHFRHTEIYQSVTTPLITRASTDSVRRVGETCSAVEMDNKSRCAAEGHAELPNSMQTIMSADARALKRWSLQ